MVVLTMLHNFFVVDEESRLTSLKSLARIRSPKVSLVPGQDSLLVGDLLLELGAKEKVVGTCDLRRRDSAEFKRSVQPTVLVGSDKGKIDSVYLLFFYLFRIMDRVRIYFSSWLAEGALSTCSNSPRVLAHSLYLSPIHVPTQWMLPCSSSALPTRDYRRKDRGSKNYWGQPIHIWCRQRSVHRRVLISPRRAPGVFIVRPTHHLRHLRHLRRP